MASFRAVRSIPVPRGVEDASYRRVVITLNGERFELDRPLSVTDLLSRLDIDPRRVAVEHNLNIIRRHTFPDVIVNDGDKVEIVNFVGGG